MSKTDQEYFADWEAYAFGYGYGSGEDHVIPLLQKFISLIPDGVYDYRLLEKELGGPVTWLLINALCRVDIIEYGTSPRGGWLTEQGRSLKKYLSENAGEPLIEADDYGTICGPSYCNCDEHYGEKTRCKNPFYQAEGE